MSLSKHNSHNYADVQKAEYTLEVKVQQCFQPALLIFIIHIPNFQFLHDFSVLNFSKKFHIQFMY